MRWTAEQVAAATGGRLVGGPEGGPVGGFGSFGGVGTDTRELAPGTLWVALRAERDGHGFAPEAIAAGAGGLMVAADWAATAAGAAAAERVVLIAVDDTGRALLDLGRAARRRLSADVAAITGSVGKTSTKDLTAAALGAGLRTVASELSFNNEIGVPRTLANAPEDTEALVLEMGARGAGHLTLLCDVAHPRVGVVTAVAAAHTDAFGDLEAVAVAKGELVAALPERGVAILNGDDHRVAAMSGRAGPGVDVLRYSVRPRTDPAADVVAEGVEMDEQLRSRFSVRSPWGTTQVMLNARGGHQVGNALAALAVAGCCGVPIADAAVALAGARLSPWRMEIGRTASGATVINDAYNANPASMIAAVDALAALPAERRVAVLGEMAELGERHDEEHQAIAALVRQRGVRLVAVGTDAYGVAPASDIDAAIEVLGPLGPGDAVLVKASRVAGLERLARRLLAG
jgi:UDP-N-acetylmuramoyl-tripeptide--D-alanyl-D-alanine ligase